MWMMWCLKVDHNTEVYVPYSFQTMVWILLGQHKNQVSVSPVRRGHGFSSLSEKTRKSNRLQMSLQKQRFLLSYLKTLSVGPPGVRTR